VNNKTLIIRAVLILIFTIIVLILYFVFDIHQLGLGQIRELVAEFGIWAPLVFVILYALFSVFLIPIVPLAILGGIMFGTFWGTVLGTISSALGSIPEFYMGRHLAKPFVDKYLKPRFGFIFNHEGKFVKNGFKSVLFLRFIPVLPFSALNYALGATRVGFKDYFWATLIGIVPNVLIYVYFGDSLVAGNLLAIVGVVIIISVFSFVVWKKKPFQT
jgi:uncharacterized membrane protein YdjX (TVP38/TMEM64 family)